MPLHTAASPSFLSAGQRRLRRCPARRGYDCLAHVAANVTIPRASRGHLGAGGAGAGVANVEPRNEGPGNPQRPRSGPARVVSFPCPSFPCPSVRIGRLQIITALPKHGVPPSLCLPGCVQAAQHHPVALEKSRMSPGPSATGPGNSSLHRVCVLFSDLQEIRSDGCYGALGAVQFATRGALATAKERHSAPVERQAAELRIETENESHTI